MKCIQNVCTYIVSLLYNWLYGYNKYDNCIEWNLGCVDFIRRKACST